MSFRLLPLAAIVAATFRMRLLELERQEQLVGPARKPDHEIALQATPRGFGTPPFEWQGEECQVRVDGAELVVRRGEEEKRERLSTLAAGAELVGHDLFPGGVPTDSEHFDLAIEAGSEKDGSRANYGLLQLSLTTA
jgi:hypothetical protein